MGGGRLGDTQLHVKNRLALGVKIHCFMKCDQSLVTCYQGVCAATKLIVQFIHPKVGTCTAN